MRNQIARSVFWMVWSRGGIQVLSLASTIVVARLLTPSDYGLMALAGIWTGALTMLADIGLGGAIVQFQDLDERELNVCFWMTMAVAWAVYCALYAVAPAIAVWFDSPRLADVLRVAGFSLPLVAVRVVPDSLLRKRLELDKVSQAEMASAMAAVLVTIGLAWAGAGVWALVSGVLLQLVVSNVCTYGFVRWSPGVRMSSRRLADIIRYSLATLGSKVGWAVYGQLDTFILGKIVGEHNLGFYSMAKQLALVPVIKVSVAVNQLASPIMARLQSDREALRGSFLKVLRLVSCITVPVCVGVALVADDLVKVALTDRWMPMVPLLQVLCLYALVHSIEVLLPPILFARYRANFLWWWTVGLLLIMPVPFWLSAVWMGAMGVALTWVFVYPVVMAWMAREAMKELGIGWSTVWKEVRPVGGAAAVMVIAVAVAVWMLPGGRVVDHVTRLTVASSVGAVVYGVAVLWRGGHVVKELGEVAGWLFNRDHLLRPAK